MCKVSHGYQLEGVILRECVKPDNILCGKPANVSRGKHYKVWSGKPV